MVSCPIQSKNIERTLICMHIPVVLAAKPKFMDEYGGVLERKMYNSHIIHATCRTVGSRKKKKILIHWSQGK